MNIGWRVQFWCAGTESSMKAGPIKKKVRVQQDVEAEVIYYRATLILIVKNASPMKCSKVNLGIRLKVWLGTLLLIKNLI